MIKKLLLCCLCFVAMVCVNAQKKMLGYPFQFEKSFLAKGEYDTYFLDNPFDSTFALILKDNKKVEYVWLNKNFKVLDSVPSPIGNTVLDQSTHKYIGGTAKGGEYHFIYKTKAGYVLETVDFRAKTVSNKKILELPSSEKLLTSFSDHNIYYTVAADDKAGEVVFYTVNASGDFTRKALVLAIPADAGKHKGKLSEYLAGLKTIKSSEEPDLSSAIKSAKLFSRPDDLSIVVNNEDNPTHIFTIGLPGYTLSEKVIDYGGLISREDKGKVYISSYLKDNMLFSLILNKKSIRISVHELPSGNLLNKFEFTDESGTNLFAEYPITEKRMGKHVDAKDLDDIKKVIRAFTKGTEGLMVTRTDAGKLVLTAGTYDMIQMSSGGDGGHWVGGLAPASPGYTKAGVMMNYDPSLHYVPGSPVYTTKSARYYNTTYFKMLLDPTTLKTVHGRVPRPVADQIKDYIDDTDKKAKATNQFAIGKNQYYGYYDRDMQEYVIEQIKLYN